MRWRKKTLSDMLEERGVYQASFQLDESGNAMSYWESKRAREDRQQKEYETSQS